MDATGAKTNGIDFMDSSDFVCKVMKGAGKIGGYVHNVLADTMYYAGKTVAFVQSVYSDIKGVANDEINEEGNLTIVRLLRSNAVIDEADQREFYANFGRDMVEATKSGLESENLTIIDVSKYRM